MYHRLRNGTSNTLAFIKIPRIAYTRMAFIIYGSTFPKVIVVQGNTIIQHENAQ